MAHLIEAQTADELWLSMAGLWNGELPPAQQDSRGGSTTELLHVISEIKDPRQRWVYSRRPVINPAFALAEIVWIMNGRRDIGFLEFWISDISKYVGNDPLAHGAYGYRLRHHHGVDQLERAFHSFRTNPDTRQVVLQIWDPSSDLPGLNGEPASADVPCNIASILKVRNNRLDWFQIIRSNDLFLGVPYNIVQFTTLQEVLAGWLGVDIGTYHQLSDSLHVYSRDENKLFRFGNQSFVQNSDSIAFDRLTSIRLFRELADKVDIMRTPGIGEAEIESLIDWNNAPTSFQNMLRVLTAEASRRHGLPQLADDVMELCTNPVFKLMWRNWSKRTALSKI